MTNKMHEKRQTKQNGIEELRKAQNQKLKPLWNQLPLTSSMQAPPFDSHLSCFFSQPPD
jgi:hypothetical protein